MWAGGVILNQEARSVLRYNAGRFRGGQVLSETMYTLIRFKIVDDEYEAHAQWEAQRRLVDTQAQEAPAAATPQATDCACTLETAVARYCDGSTSTTASGHCPGSEPQQNRCKTEATPR